MAIVKGRGGRAYDTSTGKPVQAIEHPEHRTPEAARRANVKPGPPGPTGKLPPGKNPWLITMALERQRHNFTWQTSAEGLRKLGELQRKADEWEQRYQAEVKQAEFQSSIVELVSHATTQVEAVEADENATVEDVEHANAALAAAKRGDRPAYIEWEQSRHGQVTARLASEAADYDAQARAAVEKRDAVLASGLDKPGEAPQVKPIELPQPVLIDRSRRALVDSKTGKVTIVDHDDPSIAQ